MRENKKRAEEQISSRKKLFLSLEYLLSKKSLDNIMVSEIIKESGLSRKTFYRNFRDKYDLAGWYFFCLFESSFGMITSGTDWDHALLRFLDTCEKKAIILCHAYSSRDINGLTAYDIQITKKTYEKYLQNKGADISTKEMQFAIEIASLGGTHIIIQWLFTGMKEDKHFLKDLIKRTLPTDILLYI